MTMPGTAPDAVAPGHAPAPEVHAAVLAAVVESALDAVIVTDEKGIVVTINPAAETTFGYSREEAQGRSIASLIVPEHLRTAHDDGMARYQRTRVPHVLGKRVAMEAACKDGRIIPVELAITEVSLPDQRLFTANLRDLSSARAAEREINRQQGLLHQSEKLAALGSLLAGVAHELNNPLSVVLGQAMMLREEIAAPGDSAVAAQRVERIEAAAQRCARVVRSFLAIARQREAARQAFDLVPLLDQSIDLVIYGLQSGGVEIVRDYGTGLPMVFADPDQVQQIVINLLVNAGQAMERQVGEKRITIAARAGRGVLSLRFSDNGPGVPPAIAGRIFDPFFTTKPHGLGTDIGLSVSRGLAQANGGELLLAATEGQGAVFELTLPAAPSQGVAGLPEAEVSSSEAPSGRWRVLVVDDETEVAEVIGEILETLGCVCVSARTGREAEALVSARGGFDAVISDLRMPDAGGAEFFRWLEKSHPDLARRTVFVTGDALGPAARLFLDGCDRPVIEKPFAPAEMRRIVAGLLAATGSSAG